MQLENLSFPTFELITTLPSYFSSPFALVARELSRLLHIPSMSTLNRTLSLEPRFTLKKKCNIINKGVLLLHTECQEGEELRSAGWALREGFPETLYALSFCATIY